MPPVLEVVMLLCMFANAVVAVLAVFQDAYVVPTP